MIIRGWIFVLAVIAGFVCVGAPAAAQPPLRLLTAGVWGSAGDDDIQGAAQASDGTLYLVGNLGQSAAGLPGDAAPSRFGQPTVDPKCGRGFVMHLSGDLKHVLHYAEFADGIVQLTSVAASDAGVYVSGYASDGLSSLLAGKGGLIPDYPLSEEAKLIKEGKMLEANGLSDKDPIAGRPGLGRLGAPCIIRLSPDLKTIRGGTYLEGWQQVWDKFRNKTIRPHTTFPPDYFWQPTSLAILKSGDIIVCHDGGYFRRLTDEDRILATDNPELLKRLAFYDCCDWLSRLSPDLSKRAWRRPIYTPAVDPETAKQLKNGWPRPYYSNPRTHRMRLDPDQNIYLCGWSASYTAKEPWWSPYLWKLDSADGKLIWKAYEYDPMSGADHRMNGTVSDTAVATVAIDRDGNLLTSLFADGGNTVIGWSPTGQLGRRFEGVVKGSIPGIKLVHWWGEIQRINVQTRQGMIGARIASSNKGIAGPGWVVDVAAMPDNGVLAVGRCNFDFPWTADAWNRGDADENPTAFLRVYSPDFDLLFSTALPGVVPFEVVPLTQNRYLMVGQARNPTAPAKDPVLGGSRGLADGFYCLVEASTKQAR